jgi:hypothetical protein
LPTSGTDEHAAATVSMYLLSTQMK